MGHPILSNRNSLFAYVTIWVAVFVMYFALLYYQFGLTANDAAVDSAISILTFAILALTFWFPCKYLSVEKSSLLKVLLNHVVDAMIASVIWIGMLRFVLPRLLAENAAYQPFFAASLAWRFLIGVLLYSVIAAIYYVAIYYHNFQEKLLREAELKSLVKEAELKTLKFQINPHFIFNSLNSINSLILTAPENASEMTVKLANFLRGTLSATDDSLRPLAEEIRTAKLYLDIEKVRFGDKINYIENIPATHQQIKVPAMLLQPLLENAVKHGVYESLSPVIIRLQSRLQDGFLVITLENSFDPHATPHKGEGVGLSNIKSRLAMMYHHGNLLKIEKTDDLFRVKIYIPVMRDT